MLKPILRKRSRKNIPAVDLSLAFIERPGEFDFFYHIEC